MTSVRPVKKVCDFWPATKKEGEKMATKYKKISPAREAELRELYSLYWDKNKDKCQAEFRTREVYIAYQVARERGLIREYVK